MSKCVNHAKEKPQIRELYFKRKIGGQLIKFGQFYEGLRPNNSNSDQK